LVKLDVIGKLVTLSEREAEELRAAAPPRPADRARDATCRCCSTASFEGERHQLIRRKELERFNREEWPRIIERMGPGLPGNWGGERRRLWTRRLRAPIVRRLGGRNPRYTAEQAREACRLSDGGLSIREIAARSSLAKDWPGKPVSRRQVEHMLKHRQPKAVT
jgi:hypothetical protein